METFDDGTEEEFLLFKQNLEQTFQDNELVPTTNGHSTKHLYMLVWKALSGNVLDEWIDISATQTMKNYTSFKLDLWLLTDK